MEFTGQNVACTMEDNLLSPGRGKRNPAEIDLQRNRILLKDFWVMTLVTFWGVIVCGYLSPYVGFHQLYPAIRFAAFPNLRRFLEEHDNGWGLGIGPLAGTPEARQERAFLWLLTAVAAIIAAVGLQMSVYSGYLMSLCRVDSAWRLFHEPPPSPPKRNRSDDEKAEVELSNPEGHLNRLAAGEKKAVVVEEPPPAEQERQEDELAQAVLPKLRQQREAAHEKAISMKEKICERQKRLILGQPKILWLSSDLCPLNCKEHRPVDLAHEEPHHSIDDEKNGTKIPSRPFMPVDPRVAETRQRERTQTAKLLEAEIEEEQLKAAEVNLNITLQVPTGWTTIMWWILYPFTIIVGVIVRTLKAFWRDCFMGGPLLDEVLTGVEVVSKLERGGRKVMYDWMELEAILFQERTVAIQEVLACRLLSDSATMRQKVKRVHRHRDPDMKYLNPFMPYNSRRTIKVAAFLYCVCWLPLGVAAALTSSLLGSFANFYAADPGSSVVLGNILGLHAAAFVVVDALVTAVHMWRGRVFPHVLSHRQQLVPLGGPQENRGLRRAPMPTLLDRQTGRSVHRPRQHQRQKRLPVLCSCCNKEIHPGSFYIRPRIIANSVVNGGPDFSPPDGRPCVHLLHVRCYFSFPAPWCCTCAAVYPDGPKPWASLITPKLITLALLVASWFSRALKGAHRDQRVHSQSGGHPAREAPRVENPKDVAV